MLVPCNSSRIFKQLANSFSLMLVHKHRNMKQMEVNGKVHPRTGHEVPEEDYMCNYTLSLTSALDGGGWSTPHPGRFIPRKEPVPIV